MAAWRASGQRSASSTSRSRSSRQSGCSLRSCSISRREPATPRSHSERKSSGMCVEGRRAGVPPSLNRIRAACGSHGPGSDWAAPVGKHATRTGRPKNLCDRRTPGSVRSCRGSIGQAALGRGAKEFAHSKYCAYRAGLGLAIASPEPEPPESSGDSRRKFYHGTFLS